MSLGNDFDVIVVGPATPDAKPPPRRSAMGLRTCLLTIHLDTIAQMSCNPAIGGLAKGHLVRRSTPSAVDGPSCRRTGIQFRLLNRSRGGAVQAPAPSATRPPTAWP